MDVLSSDHPTTTPRRPPQPDIPEFWVRVAVTAFIISADVNKSYERAQKLHAAAHLRAVQGLPSLLLSPHSCTQTGRQTKANGACLFYGGLPDIKCPP